MKTVLLSFTHAVETAAAPPSSRPPARMWPHKRFIGTLRSVRPMRAAGPYGLRRNALDARNLAIEKKGTPPGAKAPKTWQTARAGRHACGLAPGSRAASDGG